MKFKMTIIDTKVRVEIAWAEDGEMRRGMAHRECLIMSVEFVDIRYINL